MLKQITVDKAKPRERPYKLSDGLGLHLLVQPSGAKLWRFRYRFAGKENMLALGSFPDTSIASARSKRDAARALVADGKDPSQERKKEKVVQAVSSANTFEAIARELIDNLKADKKAAITVSKNEWLLLELAAPLANCPIKEITPAEILALLKKLEKQGKRETARRLRGRIGAVFRLAIATLRADTDPTYPLRDALLTPVVEHRAAITEEAAFGALMASVEGYTGWPTVRAALLFLALTICRPGEVRMMRKS